MTAEDIDARVMLRCFGLLFAHLLVSTAVCGAALLFGPLPDDQWASALVVGYAFLQMAAAVAIAVTSPGRRIVTTLLSLPVIYWGWSCAFVALMALSGSWL